MICTAAKCFSCVLHDAEAADSNTAFLLAGLGSSRILLAAYISERKLGRTVISKQYQLSYGTQSCK